MTDRDVTQLLQAAGAGDLEARDALIRSLYTELRRLAGSYMRRERPGHTLQPTALVNEAWLRLMKTDSSYENRGHFFASAANAMRRILVDYARERSAQKRGANPQRVTLSDLGVRSSEPPVDVLALDQALTALAIESSRLAEVVELRYFAGCTLDEIANLLDVSEATVRRDWNYSKAWLFEYLNR